MHEVLNQEKSIYLQISEMIEKDIINLYPNAQVIIHQDPAGIKETRLDTKLVRTKKSKK